MPPEQPNSSRTLLTTCIPVRILRQFSRGTLTQGSDASIDCKVHTPLRVIGRLCFAVAPRRYAPSSVLKRIYCRFPPSAYLPHIRVLTP